MASSPRHPLFCFSPAASLLAGMLAFFVCVGCSDEKDIAHHLGRADRYYTQGDLSHAEIEYLNVLNLAPDNARACAQLGSLYFDQGKFGRAAVFLASAREFDSRNYDARRRFALLQLWSGNHREAYAEASILVAQDPENPEGLLLLADSAVTMETVSEARNRLKSLTPVPATRAALLAARGVLALRERDDEEAKRFFDEAIRIDEKLAAAYAGLGAYFEAKGNLSVAAEEYAKAAQLSPPTSPHRLRLARFLLQTENTAGATKTLDEILVKAPGYLPALLRKAELAGADNRSSKAAALIDQALTLDPDNPEALLLKGRLALAQKSSERALEAVKKFQELNPDSAEGYVEAARIHLSRSETHAAMGSLGRALVLAPNHPQAVLLLAGLNIRQGNRSQAIADLRELIRAQPTLVDAHVLLADAYRGQGDFAQALAIYRRLEAVAPNNDRLFHLQGLVYLQQKQWKSAREAFERAHAINPLSPSTLEQLLNLDLSEKNATQATARIESALIKQPDRADLHVLAAKVLLARGRLPEAEASLKKAVELQPDHLIAYAMLAGRYAASGDTAGALANLQQLVRRNPRDVGAWMLSALLHEQRSEKDAARAAYERILQIDPRFSPALNNLAYLHAEHTQDLAKAYELARLAREVAPGDPYIADTLGWILYRRGDYAWAVALLRESAERLTGSADVRAHLGLAEYMLGDETGAQRSIEAALAMNPLVPEGDTLRTCLGVLKIDATRASPEQKAYLERHLGRVPSDPVALGRLAQILEESGELDRAIFIQQQATTANPQNVRGLLALCRMLTSKGETHRAMAVARQARQLSPDNPDVVITLGNLAFATGDHAWAYALLQEMSRRQPKNAKVLYALGQAAYSTGRIADARSSLAHALEFAPEVAEAGDAKELLAYIDQASRSPVDRRWIERAREKLQQDAGNVPALMVLASDARERGSIPEQRQLLQRALQTYPQFSPAKRQLAILLADNPDEDRRTFELATQAQQTFPDDPFLARALGKVTYRMGDWERAAQLLEGVIPRFADDAVAWYYLGMSQSQLKRFAEARQSLSRALDLGLAGTDATQARQQLAQVQ